MRKLLVVVCVVSPWALVGCQNPEMGFPRPFRGAGPPRQQQIQAQHFDPYPTDAGGGDITGGRPEDYHEQIPEPARSRWTLPKFLSRRPAPPPMTAAPPAGGPAVVMPQSGGAPAYPTSSYPAGNYAPPSNYPQASYPPPGYSQPTSVPTVYAPAAGVQSGGHVAGGGALNAGS